MDAINENTMIISNQRIDIFMDASVFSLYLLSIDEIKEYIQKKYIWDFSVDYQCIQIIFGFNINKEIAFRK